jgi:hypothetical protein
MQGLGLNSLVVTCEIFEKNDFHHIVFSYFVVFNRL